MRMVCGFAAFLCVASGLPCAADISLIGLPRDGLTKVTESRIVHEDWGSVHVTIECNGEPESATLVASNPRERAYLCRTKAQTGACLVQTVIFRAPTYPRSCDALRVQVCNPTQAPAKARIVLSHQTTLSGLTLSPGGLSAGSRKLISLPKHTPPVLPLNEWGLASNSGPLVNWASPNEPCDPGFRNIRVGWGGEAITYRFRVEPNSQRFVVLGLCESHWDAPKQRPLVLQVEGAPDVSVDPIAEWGRHVPRCIGFSARDVDGDSFLTVSSVTPTNAPDRNSILNVVWVFRTDAPQDLDAVKRGERTPSAEYYVDCGGQQDPSLYAVGDIIYELDLPPKASRMLSFLIACQGASAPESLTDEIAVDRLEQAASSLWAEYLQRGAQIDVPDEAIIRALNASLAAIMMVQGQASKYLVARPSLAPNSFSYPAACDIIQALDLLGLHPEAQDCLLILWHSALPEPIAQWGQRDDGTWPCPEGNWGVQGRVLSAFGTHYALTRDRAWLAEVYPSVEKGADRLLFALKEHGGRLPVPAGAAERGCDPNAWASDGLRAAAAMATAMGKDEAARRFGEAARSPSKRVTARLETLNSLADTLQNGLWLGLTGEQLASGAEQAADAATGARFIALLRSLLIDDTGGELRLLPGAPSEWLSSSTPVAIQCLPTAFGPVSFRARVSLPGVLKIALTPPPICPEAITVPLPFAAASVQVIADGWQAELSKARDEVRLKPTSQATTVVVRAQ